MSYTSSDFDYKLVFDLSSTTPSIKVRSKLNTVNGISRVDAVFTITDPFGNVIYTNSDLNSPDVSTTSSSFTDTAALVSIPTDQDGNVIEGDYGISGTWRAYSEIEVVDQPNQLLSIDPKTNGFFATVPFDAVVIDSERGLDGSYNIIDVSYTTYTVLETNASFPAPTGSGSFGMLYELGADISTSATITFCQDSFEKGASLAFSCLIERITGTDTTAYPSGSTIISKTQTLTYPAPLDKTPITNTSTTSSSIVLNGDLYTTTWFYRVQTSFEYSYNNATDSVIIDSVDKSTQVDVICLYSVCKLICCIENLNLRLQGLTEGTVEYNKVFNTMNRVTQLTYLIDNAIQCDKESIYQSNVNLLNSILDANTSDCGCGCIDIDNDTPTKVESLLEVDFSSLTISGNNGLEDIDVENVIQITYGNGLILTDNGNGAVTVSIDSDITDQIDQNTSDISSLQSDKLDKKYNSNSVTQIIRPIENSSYLGGAPTGRIDIELPVLYVDSNITFMVDLYDGLTDRSIILMISGRLDSGSNSWIGTTSSIIGAQRESSNYTIRFGNNGSVAVVGIGETTSTWTNLHVRVRDIVVTGTVTNANTWHDNWAIKIKTTSLSITDVSATPNFPWGDYNKLINIPDLPLYQEIEISGFTTLFTTPQLMIALSSTESIMYLGATLYRLLKTGTDTTTHTVYLHTTNTYSSDTELAVAGIDTASPIDAFEDTPFAMRVDPRKLAVGDDIYISTDSDASTWTGDWRLRICYIKITN